MCEPVHDCDNSVFCWPRVCICISFDWAETEACRSQKSMECYKSSPNVVLFFVSLCWLHLYALYHCIDEMRCLNCPRTMLQPAGKLRSRRRLAAPPGGTPRCRSLKYYYWSGPGLRFECYLLTVVCVLVERLRRIRIGAQERFARRRRELPLQASPMRRRLARDYACCSGFCG